MPLGSSLPSRLPFSSGAGGTYWVDPVSGNDSTGTGSSGAPWKTINKAINTVTAAGSIIKVKNGTITGGHLSYPITINSKSASTSDPITIMAENEGQVIITNDATYGQDNYFNLAAWIINSQGYRIQGFKFYKLYGHQGNNTLNSAGSSAFKIEYSDRIEIYRCIFEDIGGGAIGVNGGSSNPSSDIWIYANKFRPSGTTYVTYTASSGTGPTNDNTWCGAVDCEGVYYTTRGAHNLYIGSSTDEATVSGAERCVIANNLFVGTTGGNNVHLGPQSRDAYVVNNTIYWNRPGWYHTGDAAYHTGYGATAVSVWNNYNTAARDTQNCKVVNNIISEVQGHAAHGGGQTMTGNLVYNNLAYNVSNGYDGSTSYQPDHTDDYEETYGAYTLFQETGGNRTSADPQFQNPLKSPSGDFTLQGASPAIGVADVAYCPPDDINGNARSSTAPSLGAYEGASTDPVVPPPSVVRHSTPVLAAGSSVSGFTNWSNTVTSSGGSIKSSSGDAGAYWTTGPFTDTAIRMKVTAVPGAAQKIYLQFRQRNTEAGGRNAPPSGGNHSAYQLTLEQGSNSVKIEKWTGAVLSTIATFTQSWTTGTEFLVVMIGTAGKAYYRTSSINWALLGSFSDSSYADGYIGIEFGDATGSIQDFGSGSPVQLLGTGGVG